MNERGDPLGVVAGQLICAHEFQTILWTYVHTPVARDTQLTVEYGINRAQETARSLRARGCFVETQLNSRDADTPIDRQRGRLPARLAHIVAQGTDVRIIAFGNRREKPLADNARLDLL